MHIIATSTSQECLVAYLSTCQEPLASRLIVEGGYTSTISMLEAEWDVLSKEHQDVIIARTKGFIDGWERKVLFAPTIEGLHQCIDKACDVCFANFCSKCDKCEMICECGRPVKKSIYTRIRHFLFGL